MSAATAAHVFIVLVGTAIFFHLALAAGMPWGKLAWGGRFPGALPVHMRIASLASALLLAGFGLVVSVKAEIVLASWLPVPQILIWVVVAYCALGVIANALTPSVWERILWLPTTIGLLASSVAVATVN